MRVKGGPASRSGRKKTLKLSRGYRGARSKLIRTAVVAVERGLKSAYRDRKMKKRDFRSLWIVRINAAAHQNGISYSKLMGAINRAGINLDRKTLADLAVNDPTAFSSIVNQVRNV